MDDENPLRSNSENAPEVGPAQPIWSYSQSRERRSERQFSGHVRFLHGTQAERLRGELADVVGELLEWAAKQQSADHSAEDGAAT
ncbi:hypothetical protein K7711_02865 [Nocardia sp. CA2R105]|uniref:hypothetical protein n=1 Tax=Nocardia coffeae TaxID=2873381 RepID=UPI001CA6FF23|nr:hypothetical protein [Nocardia coffeae]MBY8855409.1 hypothetical protein [Nocardia coffeae]